MKPSSYLLVLAVAVMSGWLWLGDRRPPPPAGQIVAEDPIQTPPPADGPPWFAAGTSKLIPLASYSIRARVLSAKTYWFDRGASLVPEDLALGWGRMSDWAVYSRLGIAQTGRYYRYEWGPEGPPIPREEIVTHSANNHIIPANDEVSRALKAVRAGDIVRIKGELVEARAAAGGVWRSSLTRTDSGNGACELIYAEALTIEPR